MDQSHYRSTKEQQEKYRQALRNALIAGHKVLESGGEAMDAVVAAVSFMEGWGQDPKRPSSNGSLIKYST